MQVQVHAFLTLALDGGEWSVHFPAIVLLGMELQVTVG